MSDSEDFSSGEDEDYLPSGEEYSEDDVSELIKEEEVEEEEKQQPDWKTCKKDAKGIAPRKRKKQHRLFLDLGEGESSKDNKSDEEDGESGESHNTYINKNEERKKEDALWASFLSDVAQKPKAVSADQTPCHQKHKTAAEKNVCKPQGEPKETESNKITVTKVFDFAGEEVRVSKEVDPASKEGQQFLKEQEPKVATQTSHPTISGVKRPSSMNSLLGKMGAKKQKMSTLEKSKLDWETFKEEEGIGDELAIHNRGKDGYLERRAFLERVDYRQFEHERDIRLSNMKP
ncbi:craniofacial development protein 1 [Protobothrops mucrosquamatus]|uniref:craniofacial development protein 1 n=1 Tax=Protobothrops mucrosquamatus TaxID=103944 RepID=UPI000775BCE1|nr:craniofacial development protein 1 [Protobothrops mucrosquamatus]